MAAFHLQELKAVLIHENVIENPASILKENALTVQSFSYDCTHRRNHAGDVYGAVEPVILQFCIRVNSPHHAKQFYMESILNNHFQFSFLFNVTWREDNRLAGYEDGLVADGYVVHVEEEYHSSKNIKGVDQQMLLSVKVLVRNVTYLGRDNNLTSYFIK